MFSCISGFIMIGAAQLVCRGNGVEEHIIIMLQLD